jgi:hypothetical protein
VSYNTSSVFPRGWLTAYSYITSILGFKLSFMLTYLRFMPKGGARTTTIVVLVACVAFHLSFLIVQINLCTPVSFYPNINSRGSMAWSTNKL